MPTKSIWKSKALYLNLSGLLILILTSADVLAILPPDAVKYEAAALAILNIVNRFYTSAPVSLTGGSDDRG